MTAEGLDWADVGLMAAALTGVAVTVTAATLTYAAAAAVRAVVELVDVVVRCSTPESPKAAQRHSAALESTIATMSEFYEILESNNMIPAAVKEYPMAAGRKLAEDPRWNKPGHPIARMQGCVCDQKRNNKGLGFRYNDADKTLYDVDADCPMHAMVDGEVVVSPWYSKKD